MNLKTLHKTMLTALLLVTTVISGMGQVLLTETFNYPTPGYVGGNGIVGTTSNNWTTHSGTSGTIDLLSGSLSYPGLYAASGNKVLLPGNNTTTPRDINTGFTSSTANVMYYSALVKIIDNTQLTAAGDYFMSFGATSGTGSGALGGRLGAKSVNSGANFRFCIQNTSTGTVTFTDIATDLTFGTTYLVVVKYDRSTSPTTATLWVNPASLGGTEPAGFVSNNSGTATYATFGSICLRNSAATPKAEIDEIRVGTTFADVTPLPDVTAPTLASTIPTDEATGVVLNPVLSMTLNEKIAKGTGNITIKKSTDNAVVETIDITSASVVISNNTATITTSVALDFALEYYINVDATAIKDLSENAYAGISDKTTWNFITRAKSTIATITSASYPVSDAAWTISNIPANVSVATFESKLTPAAGASIATFMADGTTPAVGVVMNGYKVKVTAEDATTFNVYTLVVTPELTADATNNDVDHNIELTFTDDAAWRNAITALKVDATTLTLNTDYTIAAGVITLIPTGSNALTVSGSKAITVIATGYADATVTQLVNTGAISNTNSVISPTSIGVGTTSLTITAKDQYSNLISGYVFKYDATVTNGDVTTGESYTVAGTATTANVADVALAATNASGVTAFDIVIPASVDPTDGISVQVQLNDGTTNVGTALSYIKPAGPSISAEATLAEISLNTATINLTISSETFADATLDKANFTLNNAPTGVTINDVAHISSTSATVTLAYDGTDFDTDVTNFSITVAGSELTLGTPRTTNNLTITALVETAPVVTTNAAITTKEITTATWGGNVSTDGGETITEKGICWSTVALPTIADSKTTEGAGLGSITGSMTNLTASTLYYVRAYATNSVGTSYGEERSFTTLAPPPATISNTTTVGTKYYAGDNITITWTSANMTSVKVELNNGTAWSEIAASVPAANGQYVMTIPAVSKYGTAYKFRISNATDAAVNAESTGFTVIAVVNNIKEFKALTPNDIAKIKGEVFISFIRSANRNQKYIQDAEGGLLVDDPTPSGGQSGVITTAYAEKDGITGIEGKLVMFGTYTYEIVPTVDPGAKTSSNNALTPKVITLAELKADHMKYQSMLVKVQGVTIKEANGTAKFVASSVSSNYTMQLGAEEAVVRQAWKTGETDLIDATIPVGTLDIVGIVGQFTTGSPAVTTAQLQPRRVSDISVINGVETNNEVVTKAFPNPFSTDFKINAGKVVRNVVVSNMLGQKVMERTYNEIEIEVPASDLRTGVYFVTVKFEDGTTSTLRMVKK